MSILRADSIKGRDGVSAPEFPQGMIVAGIVTTTVLQQDASFTGVTTFSNANFTSGFDVVGVVTATSFVGDGSNLTNAGISMGKAIAASIVFG